MSKTIKGLTKVLKDLEKFGDEAKVEVHGTTADNATEIARDAQSRAPVDLGKLKQGIRAVELGESDFKIMTNATGFAPYSAYIEFGTGKSVRVPAELKGIAIMFKGNNEREVNIQPQPYLYPAFIKGREKYLKDLKTVLKKLTKKHG
jgi:HK97 gp10 family phage protein